MALLVRNFQLRIGAAIVAVAVALALALGLAGPVVAQQQPQPQDQGNAQATQPGDQQQGPPAQKAPEPYGGGTPLDVLMHSKLWEDVPEAKDFVKQSRPPDDALQYQPTQGDDPKGSQLLNSDQLDSLQGELEHAGAAAEHSAGAKIKHFANVHTSSAPKDKAHKVHVAKGPSNKVHAEIPTNLHGQ